MAWVADGSTEGQPSLLLSMGAVKARHGSVRQALAWHGMAWFGLTWQGPQTVAQRASALSAILTRMVMAGCGGAGKGTARQGSGRQALARRGKGHRRWHGGFTLPCHPHKDGCGVIWRGRLALG